MAIIKGNFVQVIGFKNNVHLWEYLQQLLQKDVISNTEIKNITEVFENFKWKIIDSKTIYNILQRTVNKSTNALCEQNDLLLKIYKNNEIFRATVRFSILSIKNETKLSENIKRKFEILIRIFLENYKQKNYYLH